VFSFPVRCEDGIYEMVIVGASALRMNGKSFGKR